MQATGELNAEVERTRRLVGELNAGYRTPDEIRTLLGAIWGAPVDESVRMFPPFYTAFGKRTRVGREVFINFGCTFLDQGGITLEDGVFIGPGVKIVTEGHPEDPACVTCCRRRRSSCAATLGSARGRFCCRA